MNLKKTQIYNNLFLYFSFLSVMRLKKCFGDCRGMAALVAVIVLGVSALIMGLTASVLGLGDLEMGFAFQQGGEAVSLADGCVEEALYRLKLDDNYVGGDLSFADNSCIIEVQGVGNDRQIGVFSSVDNYNHHIVVNLTIVNSVITINSWQDF